MKRFIFRLEGLLRLRREEERQAFYEVQRLRQRELECERDIFFIREERAKWVGAYDTVARATVLSHDMQLIEQYLGALDHRQLQRTKTLQGIRQQIAGALHTARLAMQARKQIEHLKEQQYRIYCEEVARAERRAVDELNMMRFAHRRLVQEEAV